MNPFVSGTVDDLTCLDEAPPCLLERTAMCVVDVAEKMESAGQFPGQDAIVRWVMCMDSNDDNTELCHSQVGVAKADVDECLSSRIDSLLVDYLQRSKDAGITGTPTMVVNGQTVAFQPGVPRAAAANDAICQADASLCSGTPAAPCYALTTQVSDAWCTTNCLSAVPNCPPTFCMCSTATLV